MFLCLPSCVFPIQFHSSFCNQGPKISVLSLVGLRALVGRSFTVSATACAVTNTICSSISSSADAGEKILYLLYPLIHSYHVFFYSWNFIPKI